MSKSESLSLVWRTLRPKAPLGLDEPDVPYMVGIFSSAGLARTPVTRVRLTTAALTKEHLPLCVSRSSRAPVEKLS
jgi:hypothetical protein